MRTTRHLVAALFMALGSAGVFGLLYYMNELNQPPTPDVSRSAKSFEVAKPPPKKPAAKKPKTRARKTVRSAPSAPMPNISSALSGLSFDLPQFSNEGLMGADQLLGGSQSSKRLVMTGDSVDSLPTPRTRKAPEYPSKARERGIEGHVVLKIKVDERGGVEQVRVVESEPSGVFDMVAVAAVHDWTFAPARYQGEAVAVSVSQRIPFRLN
jgi:periplasmic protein TonB